MATIKITLPEGEILGDGKLVSFPAPCDCNGEISLAIREYGRDEYTTYPIVDAANIPITYISGAFVSGSIVTVVIEGTKAIIQNASYANAGTMKIIGAYGKDLIKVKPLLRELNPISAGPYDMDEDNFVSNYASSSMTEKEKLYYYFNNNKHGSQYMYGGSVGYMCGDGEYPIGRYSYYFSNRTMCRSDHITRTTDIMFKLPGNYYSSSNDSRDVIFMVDNDYIYTDKHTSYNTTTPSIMGAIHKFDHSGALIASVEVVDANSWVMNQTIGVDGRDAKYCSCFDSSYLYDKLQTKNYIILIKKSYYKTTDNRHVWYHTYISKNTLKVVEVQRIVGEYDTCKSCTIYDNDQIIILCKNNDNSAYRFIVSTITEDGHTDLINSANNCSISYQNVNYDIIDIDAIYNYDINTTYYRFITKKVSDGNIYYSVVTQERFNFVETTGDNVVLKSIFRYATTSGLLAEFDTSHYDPIANNFIYGGHTLSVYPSFTPPVDPQQIRADCKLIPYSKINNCLHFHVAPKKKIYKLNLPVYGINRVEVQ